MIVFKIEQPNHITGDFISVEDALKFAEWCSLYHEKMSDKFDCGDLWIDGGKRKTTKQLFDEYAKENNSVTKL